MNSKNYYYLTSQHVDSRSLLRVSVALFSALLVIALWVFLIFATSKNEQYGFWVFIVGFFLVPVLGVFVIPSFVLEHFLQNPDTFRVLVSKNYDMISIQHWKEKVIFFNDLLTVSEETEEELKINLGAQGVVVVPRNLRPGNIRTLFRCRQRMDLFPDWDKLRGQGGEFVIKLEIKDNRIKFNPHYVISKKNSNVDTNLLFNLILAFFRRG